MAMGALTLLVWISTCNAAYMMRSSPRRPLEGLAAQMTREEPSCEDLRVMWRFSRRQNRVAEITNEIPTYRDPFAYNVWEAFPTKPRTMISTLRSGGRSWNRPVYGRIVQSAPKNHPRLGNIATAEAYAEVLRYLGNPGNTLGTKHKEPGSAFRLTGGLPRPNPLSEMGSFQHLKQLIWAERIKALQAQRLLEEAAARTVALKDVNVPAHYNRAKHLSDDIRFYDRFYNRYVPDKPYFYSPVENW